MRILIIAYYFPLETYATMAALRPYSWAKYWSRQGHEICVITRDNKNTNNSLDNVRIEEVSYLPFSKKANSDTPEKSPSKTKLRLREILLSLTKLIGTGSLLYGSNLWILPAFKRAIELYKTWQFDVIVSTYSPPASHLVAGLLKKKLDVFWLADYRDLWHDNHYDNTKFPFSWLEDKIENYYISNANLLTTVSDPLNKKLVARFNKIVITIENGFDLEDLPQEKYNFPSDSKLRLCYTGSIYPGKQDPAILFEAITLLKEEEKEQLEILFYGFDLTQIEALVKQDNLTDLVKLGGFISREDCLKIQATVDILIFLDWNDPHVEGILTGKIFEYMYSGRPIICIGTDYPTIASQLITEAGIGINLGNQPQQIANYLSKLLQGLKPSYNPSVSVLQKYTREGLAQKMLQEIIKHNPYE